VACLQGHFLQLTPYLVPKAPSGIPEIEGWAMWQQIEESGLHVQQENQKKQAGDRIGASSWP